MGISGCLQCLNISGFKLSAVNVGPSTLFSDNSISVIKQRQWFSCFIYFLNAVQSVSFQFLQASSGAPDPLVTFIASKSAIQVSVQEAAGVVPHLEVNTNYLYQVKSEEMGLLIHVQLRFIPGLQLIDGSALSHSAQPCQRRHQGRASIP